MVPSRKLPLLTPAEAYGPDIERFRDARQTLAAWWDKQTQIWSFHGALKTQGGRLIAYQLSFIDRHMQNDFVGAVPARWLKPRLCAATFSISDPMNGETDKTFRYWQRGGLLSRAQGFASEDRFHVEVDGWYAFRRDNGAITLYAHAEGDSLQLELEPSKPVAYHGQSGYAQRDPNRSNISGGAAFYCSYPRLKTSGRLLLDGKLELVDGVSWLDHEKLTSTPQFKPQNRSFSDVLHGLRHERIALHLDGERDLMLFSTDEKSWSGSWINAMGDVQHLIASEIRVENFEYFISARTGARYPIKRKIVIDSDRLELDLRPALTEQEIETSRTNLSCQWNGLVNATGTQHGAQLKGHGFMELAGFDPRPRAKVFEFLTGT